MAQIELRGGRKIADYSEPYIIAEVNTSHYGKIDIAKQMIDEAKAAGCNCVKFQSWSADSLYSKTYYGDNPYSKRMVARFSFSPEQLKELAEYCKGVGIDFSSTPYSKVEVDFLVDECDAPFIKVSSMEANNLEFIEYVAKKNVPIILSTGMAEAEEIDKIVSVIKKCGNENLVLLHCVSIYPADVNTINLNNIAWLRDEYPECPVGFSDHTLGETASIGAIALGAAVLEKHMTLDASKIGMDNQMAMEPESLKQYVEHTRIMAKALGDRKRTVLPEEYEQRRNMRRSIVSARELKAGEIIRREDLDVKRPGTGIPPDKIDLIIGKRVVRNIEADIIVDMDDFK